MSDSILGQREAILTVAFVIPKVSYVLYLKTLKLLPTISNIYTHRNTKYNLLSINFSLTEYSSSEPIFTVSNYFVKYETQQTKIRSGHLTVICFGGRQIIKKPFARSEVHKEITGA
jgi:hypothetical protein